MTRFEYKNCTICGKSFTGTTGEDSRCFECFSKEEDEKLTAHFAWLDTFTLEVRVRKIEEWIYNYKPPVNIRDIQF